MADERKLSTRKRGAQMNVRLDESLYVEYKELLEKEGTSMTEDIESYIRGRLGREESETNVVDIRQVIERQQQEIAEIKAELGKLRAG
ncbi:MULTISPECIES: hypothetical protein [Nostoc]|nr:MULTISPECIES: hypothetical protein [Nostoc]MBW4457557.1 hypothetical protein [Nostoc indistinguendum CM1-VF10]MBD2248433.1 hypothetical protein [Nostoc sp. FACHB-888]MBD2535393.1 hypothetical protein [Nostoc flagelliforme FACHB-838]MBN3907105.1 hypothetical protein [Nostoc sp. NMS1]MBN3993017.1 hypothetical protein [Nostoc sp. NMS2]